MKLAPDVEARCLAMADARPTAMAEPAPVFTDEAAFQAAVIAKAKEFGWLAYHTHDSRRSESGFPDLLMIRRNRLLVWELKRSRREKPTAAQRRWLKLFQGIPGAEVRIFSPEDWDTILEVLKRVI